MADRVCSSRRALLATAAGVVLFLVLIAIAPHQGATAAELSPSGSAHQYQTLHHESTLPAVRTTTATKREPIRVGAFGFLGGVATLVLVVRAASHRSRVTTPAHISIINHGRAPPLLPTSN
jgi:hypothetical protein